MCLKYKNAVPGCPKGQWRPHKFRINYTLIFVWAKLFPWQLWDVCVLYGNKLHMVVAIAGKYRTGKSYLMNLLAGHTQGTVYVDRK